MGQGLSKHEYSVREAAELLGLSAAEVRRCVRAGILTAPEGAAGPVRLGFQDLVLLRRAASLISSRVAPHRVRRALRRLKDSADPSRPLSGIDVSAEGAQLVARSGGDVWNPESQQLLFDFGGKGAASTPSPATVLVQPGTPPAGPQDVTPADDWYALGCALEDDAPEEAAKAYQRAVALEPRYAASWINWGRLLHVAGEAAAAEEKFRQALACDADIRALAWFNLGVALEDQARLADALEAYQEALRVDPRCEDAHYNAARLYERLGQRTAALRHLKQYRALTQRR